MNRSLFERALGFHRAGRLDEAVRLYQEILDADPRNADSLHLIGVVARQQGRSDKAADMIRQAIAIDRRVAVYHLNLGNALSDLGLSDQAVGAYREAVRLQPDFTEAHFNLGNELMNDGSFDAAIAAFTQAIRHRPDFAPAHTNLGIALDKIGRCEKAVEAHCEAIRLNPGFAEARFNLGVTLHQMGYLPQAISSFDAALRIKPDYSEARINLGNTLCESGQHERALDAFDASLHLGPDNAEAHNGRSVALVNLGEIIESALSAQRAVTLRPDHAEAYNNLGNSQRDRCEFRRAEMAYATAVKINPDYAAAYSNLALFQHYRSDIADELVIRETKRFAQRFGGAKRPKPSLRRPSGRVKVGYVSGDFRRHSVSNFLLPLLLNHDRTAFEIFCYSNNPWRDDLTERIAGVAEHWRQISGLDDSAAEQMIAADGIDILVDISGHTALNRLLLFARKPAPIQVTWLGYPGSTGLEEIDFRLVDAITDPPGTDAACTETLVRLDPGFLCYAPVDQASPTRAGDAETRKIRFGSFNTLAKLSDATLEVWSELLAKVPQSELLLKGRPFADPQIRRDVTRRFADHGLDGDRLILLGHIKSQGDHLAAYAELDIALDPFPYNGTTTTCEALWMGVPVVALRGTRHSGRVGASLLTQVGLESLIAETRQDYIEIAAGLAADRGRVSDLRRDLRRMVADSPLCDEQGFARRIEAAFLGMFKPE